MCSVTAMLSGNTVVAVKPNKNTFHSIHLKTVKFSDLPSTFLALEDFLKLVLSLANGQTCQSDKCLPTPPLSTVTVTKIVCLTDAHLCYLYLMLKEQK